MREFKGTKGEWKILDNNKAIKWVNVESDKGVIIRTFYGNVEPIVTSDEAEFNAKLIAAAPELLEACTEALRMYREIQPTGGWQGVEDMLKDSITKALGE